MRALYGKRETSWRTLCGKPLSTSLTYATPFGSQPLTDEKNTLGERGQSFLSLPLTYCETNMKSHAQNRVSSSSNSKQKLPNSIRILGKQGMQFPYCMMSQILFVWQPELEAILSSVGLCCFIALFGVLLAQKCSFWVLTFWHVSYIFFSCLCLVFYFLTVFAVQKFLIFMLPHVPIFFFMVYGFFFCHARSFHSRLCDYSCILSCNALVALFFAFRVSGIYLGGWWHFFP